MPSRSRDQEEDVRTLIPPPGGDNPTLGALLDQVARYRAIAAQVLCLVAKRRGLPGAIMFFDVADAEAVLTRFVRDGTPTCWHAGTALALTLHGLDLADDETRAEVAPIARGRWFWAPPAGEPALIDAHVAPPPQVAGRHRAERRRQERAE